MTRTRKGLVGPFKKKMLYLASVTLWVTGAIWLYLQYCVKTTDEIGSHPKQTLLLQIHGAAAMGFLIVLGAVLFHVKPGWRQKHQRSSGLSLITPCVILIISGWGLYYLGDEYWRNWTSIIHCVLGVLLPGFILFHVINARIIHKRNVSERKSV
ncbi:MAG: hypothetical protein KGJ11_00050 [Candidatus Omnitrophica bacterium]|nr:hypothetical protein [Candidatus Omnitrophota bacterium]